MLAELDLADYLKEIREQVCACCVERPAGAPPLCPLGKAVRNRDAPAATDRRGPRGPEQLDRALPGPQPAEDLRALPHAAPQRMPLPDGLPGRPGRPGGRDCRRTA